MDKVAITHLAMEIHFQTTDHVVAVEKVAEQHIARKYSKCNSFRVISHIIILGKSAITHSKVGQSSPNPKNFEERKNSLAGREIIMGWESCGVVEFELGPLLQGQTRIAKLKSAYNSLILGPRGLEW